MRCKRQSLSQVPVGGEEALCGAAPHPFRGALHRNKCRMPFVQVVDLRSNFQPQQPQSLDQAGAADAKDDLLAQSRVPVPAVEMPGNPPILFAVPRHIGIQQVQVNPTNLRNPYTRHHCAAGERDPDLERHAVSGENRSKWNRVNVHSIVDFALATGTVDALPEIAIAIQQPYTKYRQSEVTVGLDVISSQHAESTGVNL